MIVDGSVDDPWHGPWDGLVHHDSFNHQMDAIFAYLDRFSALNAQERAALQQHLRPKQYNRGDAYVKAGAQCHSLGYVVEGVFQALHEDADGRQSIMYFNTPRWNPIVCDLRSVVTKGPSQYTIRAAEPSYVIEIRVSDLHALYDAHHGLERLGRKLAEFHYLQAMDKVHLTERSAEDKVKDLLEKQPGILNQVPAKLVASYLGMTEATLSRQRKKILLRS